jgi:hypothetical protein
MPKHITQSMAEMVEPRLTDIGDAVRCLLMAQSGHPSRATECPLLGVKQTSQFEGVMSAFDPKGVMSAFDPKRT